MPIYLVTGRGGTGKSTICKALRAKGYDAFDGDAIPGLARAESFTTKEPVQVNWSGFVDFKKVAWNWQEPVLDAFVRKHATGTTFLCGSSSNQFAFHNKFMKIFVLVMSPKTHERHFERRQSSYGKDPYTRTWLLDAQRRFAEEAISTGAIPLEIGPTDSPTDTVNKLLTLL